MKKYNIYIIIYYNNFKNTLIFRQLVGTMWHLLSLVVMAGAKSLQESVAFPLPSQVTDDVLKTLFYIFQSARERGTPHPPLTRSPFPRWGRQRRHIALFNLKNT